MRKTVLAKGATMSVTFDEARTYTRELVRKSEYQCGSRMVAYERVAQTVGMSAAWVRKLIHGYGGDVRLLHTTVMNIKAAYECTCLAIERKAQELEGINEANTRSVAPNKGVDE